MGFRFRGFRRAIRGLFKPIEKIGKGILSPFRQGKDMAKALQEQSEREEEWRMEAEKRQNELDSINAGKKRQEDQIAEERRRTEQMKNNLDDQDKTITEKTTEYNGGSANAGSGVLINEEEIKRNQGNAQSNGGDLDDYRERLKRMMAKK